MIQPHEAADHLPRLTLPGARGKHIPGTYFLAFLSEKMFAGRIRYLTAAARVRGIVGKVLPQKDTELHGVFCRRESEPAFCSTRSLNG